MVRTLTLASVLALLPAVAVAQDATGDAMNAKSAEAEAAADAHTAPMIGLPVGARTPDAQLTDSDGATVTFADLAGEKGVVVAFVRSADWCPFCKKQMVELEQAVAPLEDAGWTLAALSYDSTEVLSRFKGQNELSYTFLSDPDSEAIRAFNLFNEDMKEGSRTYGIPHPAIVFLGADGTVRATLREDGYRTRPAVETVIETASGL